MMRLNTSQAAEFSSRIGALNAIGSDVDSSLQGRVNSIREGIAALQAFFMRLQAMGEQTEQSLMNDLPFAAEVSSGFSAGWSASGNLAALAAGASAAVKGHMSYALGSASAVYEGEYLSASVSAAVLQGKASGTASVRLMDEGRFSPEVNAAAGVQGSLLASAASASVSTPYASAKASAAGEVGAVYAGASAVINPNEIRMEAAVGAAALRGECSFAFSLFGATVTVTGSGSVGSAEAGLSFAYSNREWEIGSKLGFIAGLGFKLKVEY
ncbi:MAG: hypothetical protein HUJ54_13850 [Erysipelotrichaceae bacterium]|nr:hypothetical protein [Erysipelotrichaceae bacterium]